MCSAIGAWNRIALQWKSIYRVPNTSGLRAFHDPGRLRVLVQAVASEMSRPLFVKLPPWERNRQSRENGISLAETAIDAGANGVIIANTRPVEHVGLKVGRGGMSGAPLFDDTLRMTAEVRASLGNRGAIIACGGIGDARQVWRLLAVGAEAVQLYTGLVYEGPGLPGSINRNLVHLMERAECRSVGKSRAPHPIRAGVPGLSPARLQTPAGQLSVDLFPRCHRFLRSGS